MKILLMYDYPPTPGGLSTQGGLLQRGLQEIGTDVQAVHLEATLEKEWYYRWFRPDVAVGIGYWGHTPQLVLHPQQHGILPVPWLVADGYVGNYQAALDALPLLLVTSRWVKSVYVRDGLNGRNIDVLPVGCDTDAFCPRDRTDPKVALVRETLGVTPDECMILTIGGDAASKGAQEVMQALALIRDEAPPWRYVCKVWPQARTSKQNRLDLELARHFGLESRVAYVDSIVSRNYVPYLTAACDIYAAPSRLEGFGMPPVEASASAKPVLGIRAMGMLDTQVHCKTAFLADIGMENRIPETVLGPESGFRAGHRVVFEVPRIADYRANVPDLAAYLLSLLKDPHLRHEMGEAGRRRAVQLYDYRVVARRLLALLDQHLGLK